MIITAEEFRSFGFDWSDDAELEKAIKRAEYVVLGLTDGKANKALAAGGTAARYVKQAAAMQTLDILTNYYGESGSSSDKHEERVSVGADSYSSSVSSESTRGSGPLDAGLALIGMLRAVCTAERRRRSENNAYTG